MGTVGVGACMRAHPGCYSSRSLQCSLAAEGLVAGALVGILLLAPIVVHWVMILPTVVPRGEPIFLPRRSCLWVDNGAIVGLQVAVLCGCVRCVAYFACVAASEVVRFCSATHAGVHMEWYGAGGMAAACLHPGRGVWVARFGVVFSILELG